MADFLLELRSEEIPARMQDGARAELAKLFTAELAKAGLTAERIETFATPRRLALIAYGLPLETQAVSEETKGPKVGAPPQALEGFLRKTGLTQDQLTERDGVYFAIVEKPGRKTADVLTEAIPAIIRGFSWPKSMRWGAASASTESLRWVRPLQGIVALFGDDVVPCEVDGIISGSATMGHRFHHHGSITIGNAADYAGKLRACHVIVDQAERQAIIREGAAKAAAAAGLTLVPDEALVAENAGLTEWPVPLLGRFDAAFLAVPPEVIRLTARLNQKYFMCTDAAGKLANAFVCTANISAHDGGEAIIAGNERVLAARLSDAKFFYEQDLKIPLADHAKKLDRIVFHEKLGTVADKVERVAKLAEWLVTSGVVKGCTPQAARQAAELCKADLVTGMVGEFPELQGVMGGYYARAQELPDAVADAIRDHYKPVGQGDEAPTAPVTVAVSLADKLDTLAAFFLSDQMPTGSKDPFALRRSALAIISLLADNKLRLNLTHIFELVYRNWIQWWRAEDRYAALVDGWHKSDIEEAKDFGSFLVHSPFYNDSALDDIPEYRSLWLIEIFGYDDNKEFYDFELTGVRILKFLRFDDFLRNVLDFFADRLKVQQKEAGVRHDLIDAVFALGGEDDLVRLLARVQALQAFITTEDGANLLVGYKRAANILKAAGPSPSAADAAPPSPARGEGNDAELALQSALNAAEPQVTTALEAEDFTKAMSVLATLRAPIDHFFTDVMVNDPDADVRAFRLGLLARFRDAVHKVADFSKIEG